MCVRMGWFFGQSLLCSYCFTLLENQASQMQILRKNAGGKLLLVFAVYFYWLRILHGTKEK